MAGAKDGAVLIIRDKEVNAILLAMGHRAIAVAAFVPGGRVVTVDVEQHLQVFDVERRASVAELMSPVPVEALRISRDGHRVVTIPVKSRPVAPVLWSLDPPHLIARLEGHNTQVYSARFVNNEREILTAGTDGTARLWDSATGQAKLTYSGSVLLLDAAMSPDGAIVAGGDVDGVLRCWCTATGASLWALPAHTWLISGLHFEGDALISRGGKGDLARWELPRSSAVGSSIERFDQLVRCGPLRFDEATGGLVAQSPPMSCDGQR